MSESLTNLGAYNPFSMPEGFPRLDPPLTVRQSSGHEESRSASEVGENKNQGTSFVDDLQLSREAEAIRELQMRDREVRAHEMAHAAIGGSYAGPPTYTYERGPDGRSYAVGGSVSIDVSPVPGDPQATLQKAQQVRAAALAPVQPSSKDMQVAQQAQAMAADARNEIRLEQMEERKEMLEREDNNGLSASIEQSISAYSRTIADSGPARLEIYS